VAISEVLADPAADATRMVQMGVAVEEVMGKVGLRRERVRYSIPGQSVFTRFVKLPPLDEEKVDEIVRFEAQQNVPFPMNEVAWDYQLVGDSAGEVEVVLVAIKADALDEYNDAVEATGARTDSVDLAPMALYNAFRYNYSDIEEPSLLIDIGARTTNLIFVEGNRLYARNVPFGGASLTQAIAKEFQVPFAKAESMKRDFGMVSLGGAYQEPEDEEVAAVARIIRQNLTRLHTEVVRTTGFYRNQHGGALPQRVFLCGASAGLPYLREFFEEKLKAGVEHFNALRNVAVDAGIDMEEMAVQAHALGELVGLALRDLGSCPMEIDLVPDVVESRRDVGRRMPFLVLASVLLLGSLGIGQFYFQRAASLASDERRSLEAEKTRLERDQGALAGLLKEFQEVEAKGGGLIEAVELRTEWLRILEAMNRSFETDVVWVTQFEPLVGGEAITAPLGGSSGLTPTRPGSGSIDEIRVQGLYRPDRGGVRVVYDYGKALAESGLFAMSDYEASRESYVEADSAAAGDRWAYRFTLRLPLSNPIPLRP